MRLLYLFDVLCEGTSVSKLLWNNDPTAFWTMVQALAVTITLILILRQMMAQVGQLKLQAEELKIQADQLKLQTDDLKTQTQQVSAQRLTNMLSSISTFNQSWDGNTMAKARIEICQDYLASRLDIESVSARLLLHHFEELGTFYHHGLFERDVLWSLFSETICWYWLLCEGKIAQHRKVKNDPTFYEYFESLKNSMKEHSKDRGLEDILRTEDDIRAMANSQITLLTSRQEP